MRLTGGSPRHMTFNLSVPTPSHLLTFRPTSTVPVNHSALCSAVSTGYVQAKESPNPTHTSVDPDRNSKQSHKTKASSEIAHR